jgi:integrase
MFPLLEKTDFGEKKTVGYYYTQMIRYKEIKESSLIRYHSTYENHIKRFEDLPINELKTSQLREWVAGMNCSPKSVRMNVSVFSQILNEALLDEAIDKNLFNNVRLPKLIKYEPKPFNNEEIILLLSKATGWFHNALGFLFCTGMRIGEALALEWKDIKDDYIIVSKTINKNIVTSAKTGNIRQIPIFDSLKPFLKAQRLESGLDRRVFPKATGTNAIRAHWKKLLRRCEMGERILYQTRHTFTIKALDSGKFTVSEIAYMLGHSSTKMLFDKYAKFIKSESRKIDSSFSVLDTNLDTQAV